MIGAGAWVAAPAQQLTGQRNLQALTPRKDASSLRDVPRIQTSVSSTIRTNATVIRVVDGDTLDARLDGEDGDRRVRLLGINTPETVDPRRPVECFGKEASTRMKNLVDGQRVSLIADPQADERDKYGRLLRNVISGDGTDVNAAMVREGYAHAYLSFPLDPKRKRELKKLEQDARIGRRGLWNPETCKINT